MNGISGNDEIFCKLMIVERVVYSVTYNLSLHINSSLKEVEMYVLLYHNVFAFAIFAFATYLSFNKSSSQLLSLEGYYFYKLGGRLNSLKRYSYIPLLE